MEENLEDKINLALEEIRPFLHADGGDIELVSIEDNVVSVRFLGSCTHCSVNQMTFKSGIEHTIKNKAPEIKEVHLIES